MKIKDMRLKSGVVGNKIFLFLTFLYVLLLILIASLAGFFSYQSNRAEILGQMDLVFSKLEKEYEDISNNFWQIYMPIFERDNNIYGVMEHYFVSAAHRDLTPLEKLDLSQALDQMLLRDGEVQWIALYDEARNENYIKYAVGEGVQPLPTDFPYLKEMQGKSGGLMEIYGVKELDMVRTSFQTFAICGGVPKQMGNGKILVGYSIAPFEQICKMNPSTMETLRYKIVAKDALVFDSSGKYAEDGFFPEGNMRGIQRDNNNRRVYVNSKRRGNVSSVVSYMISWNEIMRHFHNNTLNIFLIVVIFVGVSIVLNVIILRIISKEVGIIQQGLNEIGRNHLEYRIPDNFVQSGLPEIASSINEMTVQLQENINRAYHYQLRQKNAELSELQAKFNPHFLYNTLEMIRSRCEESGDTETAELTTQMSAIFRGFIGSKTFIPLGEELAFSRRYLSLFTARYGDRVSVRFDIETSLLEFGVIRNIFQPLIENYFIHSFDTSNTDNYILFRGHSLDHQRMVLIVEDNGYGMSAEEIEEINNEIHEHIILETESYGLKNLHQRLRLFYGEDCGLRIEKNNADKGIRVHMTLCKMTCEEYEKSQKI